MSEVKRRADAERSIAAILDAALEVLPEHPDASMSEIAAAAGVARQTVYAHYRSREQLLAAVADRALGEAVAAIDAAEPDAGDPGEALERLVDAWWRTVARHARVLEALAAGVGDERTAHALHAPIRERLERLVRRGRQAGVFEGDEPIGWSVAAFLGLMHTAADEVAAGRIEPAAAGRALRRTIPRLLGAAMR